MFVFSACFLYTLFYSAISCQFPSYMTGSWSDSKFFDVEFTDGNSMFLSRYSIEHHPTDDTSNLTCYLADGNRYVTRTTDPIHAIISGVEGEYYLYLCMEITQITQYSFYYYLQSGKDNNGERLTAYLDNVTSDSLSAFCTETISLELFQVMVKNGFENQALQTCPTPLLGSFGFVLSYNTDASCSTGTWNFTDNTYSTVNITYTSGQSCTATIGHSANALVGCVLCLLSGSTYYTSIINFDSSVDETLYYRFTCLITELDGENTTLSQRARVCYEGQTSNTMTDFSSIYPFSHSTLGSTVYLVSHGERPAITSDCFPKSDSSDGSSDSSNNLAVVIAVVVLVLIILFIMIAICLFWKKKIKRKTRVSSIVPRRKGRFTFRLRTALFAGMGSSKKRQKSFVNEHQADILVINHDRKQTPDTEDDLNVSPTPHEDLNKDPVQDNDVNKTPAPDEEAVCAESTTKEEYSSTKVENAFEKVVQGESGEMTEYEADNLPPEEMTIPERSKAVTTADTDIDNKTKLHIQNDLNNTNKHDKRKIGNDLHLAPNPTGIKRTGTPTVTTDNQRTGVLEPHGNSKPVDLLPKELHKNLNKQPRVKTNNSLTNSTNLSNEKLSQHRADQNRVGTHKHINNSIAVPHEVPLNSNGNRAKMEVSDTFNKSISGPSEESSENRQTETKMKINGQEQCSPVSKGELVNNPADATEVEFHGDLPSMPNEKLSENHVGEASCETFDDLTSIPDEKSSDKDASETKVEKFEYSYAEANEDMAAHFACNTRFITSDNFNIINFMPPNKVLSENLPVQTKIETRDHLNGSLPNEKPFRNLANSNHVSSMPKEALPANVESETTEEPLNDFNNVTSVPKEGLTISASRVKKQTFDNFNHLTSMTKDVLPANVESETTREPPCDDTNVNVMPPENLTNSAIKTSNSLNDIISFQDEDIIDNSTSKTRPETHDDLSNSLPNEKLSESTVQQTKAMDPLNNQVRNITDTDKPRSRGDLRKTMETNNFLTDIINSETASQNSTKLVTESIKKRLSSMSDEELSHFSTETTERPSFPNQIDYRDNSHLVDSCVNDNIQYISETNRVVSSSTAPIDTNHAKSLHSARDQIVSSSNEMKSYSEKCDTNKNDSLLINHSYFNDLNGECLREDNQLWESPNAGETNKLDSEEDETRTSLKFERNTISLDGRLRVANPKYMNYSLFRNRAYKSPYYIKEARNQNVTSSKGKLKLENPKCVDDSLLKDKAYQSPYYSKTKRNNKLKKVLKKLSESPFDRNKKY